MRRRRRRRTWCAGAEALAALVPLPERPLQQDPRPLRLRREVAQAEPTEVWRKDRHWHSTSSLTKYGHAQVTTRSISWAIRPAPLSRRRI